MSTVAGQGSATRRRLASATARHAGTVVPIVVLTLVLGWAAVPSWFAGADPLVGVSSERFLPPGWGHPFGTDHLGRDLYARVVHGTATSLGTAVLAATTALVPGILLGLAAGYGGRWVDGLIGGVIEVVLSIPSLLLSLLVIGATGGGTVGIGIAVGAASVAGFARLSRAATLQARAAVHVEAAVMVGARWWRLLGRYVLPAVLGPVLALAVLEFALIVLAVSALTFLGFGRPPPAPEWGSLVAAGGDYIASAWWLSALPGTVVAVVVLAIHQLARRGDRGDTW